MVPLPLEWTVQKESSAKMELVNLHPGTVYNITITSDSEEFGEGGSNSIKAETEIGTPDPEPEQVRVLSQKGETMEIEIPTMTNNNGPISAVYVVVIYVDTEISQSFDEHLLTHYKQAQEDGSSYYIAAELKYEVSNRISGRLNL